MSTQHRRRAHDATALAASGGLRASDADRERTAAQLREHAVRGRLDLLELEERAGLAHAARTRGELAALTADLPPVRLPKDRARRAGRRRAAFRHHVRHYVAVMALLVAIWLVTGAGYFWPVWPMLGWGVALVSCAAPGRSGRRPVAARRTVT